MPKLVIGFPDGGIGPNQGDDRCGNEQYTAGNFFTEKPLEGSKNLVGNQLPGGCHVLMTV
jgi:hypothetical protein